MTRHIPESRNTLFFSNRIAVIPLLVSSWLLACSQNPGLSIAAGAPRPALGERLDTASAVSYHNRGVELLRSDPDAAAVYFQWAARLAPDRVEPLQGWRAAVLIRNLKNLSQILYSSGRDNTESRLADSLFYEGMVRAPLAYRQFDSTVREAFLDVMERELVSEYGIDPAQARFALEGVLQDLDPEVRGWNHYVNRRWDAALADYDLALRRARGDARGHLHVERAHILGVSGRLGLAREELSTALDAFREQEEDAEELRPYYESKAMYLYIIGALWEVEDAPVEAEEAYGQAVVEDLSFHPAHVSLARMALEREDTAMALSEYRLAVDLRPEDAVLRVQFAKFLTALGDVDVAISQFVAATETNPWWAAPHKELGILYEESGEYGKAMTCYGNFLARAAQDDPDRAWAVAKRDLMASRIK